MVSAISMDGVKITGEKLSELLLHRPEYRARWEPYRRRGSPRTLNQAAIAQVIALYLWETGERPERETDLPRVLKDRVHRALAGEVLSPQTLSWFVGAFGLKAADAAMLRALRFGRPMGAAQPPVVDTLRSPGVVPLPQQHRTVSVFERRMIDAAGRPVRHRSTRALIACADEVVSYPYRLMSGARDITVRYGGRVTARHEFNGSAPVLEITLTRPLAAGDVASLEYEVHFDASHRPVSEYRRVAHERVDNLDLVVEFSRRLLPRGVWWTVWDTHRGGNRVHEEPVELDAEGCVHRFVPYLENAAVGFRWTW